MKTKMLLLGTSDYSVFGDCKILFFWDVKGSRVIIRPQYVCPELDLTETDSARSLPEAITAAKRLADQNGLDLKLWKCREEQAKAGWAVP